MLAPSLWQGSESSSANVYLLVGFCILYAMPLSIKFSLRGNGAVSFVLCLVDSNRSLQGAGAGRYKTVFR